MSPALVIAVACLAAWAYLTAHHHDADWLMIVAIIAALNV